MTERLIKGIFFDIDGTLRDFESGKIPDSTKEALLMAKDAGIRLFIATGRHRLEIEEENLLEGIPFDGYVTLNGQYCYCNEKVIYDLPICSRDVKRTLNLLKKEPFPCMFMEKDRLYINMVNQLVVETQERIGTKIPPVIDVERARNQKIYQIIPFVSSREEQRLRQELTGCEFVHWHDGMAFDIIPENGSKWKGILKMAQYFGMDPEETAAVGDGKNDISMILGAGLGIAMGNASKEVIQTAGYVTGPIDQCGLKQAVLHILNHNMLGGMSHE